MHAPLLAFYHWHNSPTFESFSIAREALCFLKLVSSWTVTMRLIQSLNFIAIFIIPWLHGRQLENLIESQAILLFSFLRTCREQTKMGSSLSIHVVLLIWSSSEDAFHICFQSWSWLRFYQCGHAFVWVHGMPTFMFFFAFSCAWWKADVTERTASGNVLRFGLIK